MTTFNKDNFFQGTEANFISCDRPAGEPDYSSDGGSDYWYTENGVVRGSGHWLTTVATCNWSLNGEYVNNTYTYGYCDFKDFSHSYVWATSHSCGELGATKEEQEEAHTIIMMTEAAMEDEARFVQKVNAAKYPNMTWQDWL